MKLRDHMAEYRRPFDAILAVASCRDSILFADLCWPPFNSEIELSRLISANDAGVMFETSTRVVVVEEHSAELRYYAGGWCSNYDHIYLEQYRMEAEGCELGVFDSPRDAVNFAACFLVQEQALQDIEIPRRLNHQQATNKNWQAEGCS